RSNFNFISILISCIPSYGTVNTCLITSFNALPFILSLHDALPISMPDNTDWEQSESDSDSATEDGIVMVTYEEATYGTMTIPSRSEEHTSELQSRFDLVCRLLLEKKIVIYRFDGTYKLGSIKEVYV